MDYSVARNLIRDGDLIAFRARGRIFHSLIRRITGSPYTHTAVAVWIADGLWLAEMGAGGNVLVPASQHSNVEFDVFNSPVGRDGVRREVFETLRLKMKYDVLDLLRIACSNLLRFKLPTDTGGRVCSAYTALIYKQAGWAAPELPNIPSPADVVTAFGREPRLTVRT